MNAIEELLRGHIRSSREAIADAVSRVDALEGLVNRIAEMPEKAAEPLTTYRHNEWSDEEEQILRAYYADVGAAGCVEMLPHRTSTAIRTHAHKLGIINKPSARRYFCDQCDARVTAGQIAVCKSKFCKGKALVAKQ